MTIAILQLSAQRGSEAVDDLILAQTSLLLLSSCFNAN